MILRTVIKKQLRNFTLEVDFTVNNEVLALLGGSGCGKSMTLKCIAGIEKPDEGYIELNGKVLFDSSKRKNLPPQKRKIGYLFQNYALFPNMTVSENISFISDWKKEEVDSKISELIKRFNLQGLENAYPGKLSGGQQQRVAFARILASQADILLLDEPFAALDTSLKWQMETELISLLNLYDHSALLVSHDRGEVFRLSDKIAVMNKGKIAEFKNKIDLFEKPQTYESALLTGITNISEFVKVDENHINATEWGLNLKVCENIAISKGYVAIKSEHISLEHLPDTDHNTFPMQVHDIIEDISDNIIIAKSDNNSLKPIRYISKKDRWENLENKTTINLRFPEDRLILIG